MSVLEQVIGWLAPADCVVCTREGSPLCNECASFEIIPFGERCFSCNSLSINAKTCTKCALSSPSHVWLTTDYEKTAAALVHRLKFTHQRAAVKPMAALMLQTLEDFGFKAYVQEKNYVVVPVPSATSRVRQRSFDHTALLAGRIAKNLGLTMSKNLRRLGQSRQVGAKRALRQSQTEDNYYVANQANIKGKNVLLIDDVVTTGATLRAATRQLRKAGAKKVDALVFAKKL